MATPNNGGPLPLQQQQQPRAISPTASTSAQPYGSTGAATQQQQQISQQRQRPSMSSSASSGSIPTSHMESTITRLLVATKQLLEGLAKWSRGEVGEDVISEIYVKLGNDFNVACAAFAKENIGMNELLSVPSDLRICLETCLSDTPSQQTLEKHLPKVRQIIIGLLHGLREKQRMYRDGAAARRVRETQERERERDRIKEMARSGELVRSGSMSGGGGSAGGGAASQARREMQQQQQQGQGHGQGQGKDPLTPNSASRSRDELRKFVTQAKASAMPMPSSSSSSTRTATPQPVYPSTSTPTSNPSSTTAEPTLPPSSSSSSASSFVSTTSTSNGQGRYDDALPPSSSSTSSTSLKQSTRSRNPEHPAAVVRDSALPIAPNSRRGGGGSMREKERESIRSSRSAVSEGGDAGGGGGAPPTLPHSKSSSSLAGSLGNVNLGGGGGGGGNRPTSGERTRAYSPPPPPREVDDPGPVPLTPTFVTSPTPSFQSRQLSGDAAPPALRPSSALSIHSTTTLDDPPPPPPPPPPLTPTTTLEASQSAAQMQSLEALKASDNLSRRASKRYSAYTIQKMTSPAKEGPGGGGGASSRGERLGRVGEEIRRAGSGSSAGREWAEGERRGVRGAGGGEGGVRRTKSELRPMRGEDGGGGRRAIPPLPALPASLSAGSGLSGLGLGGAVGTILEEDGIGSSREGTPELGGGPPSFPPPPVPSSTSPTESTTALMKAEPPAPSPSIVSPIPISLPPSSNPAPPQSARSSLSTSSPIEPSFPLSIFLQLGRDVKKVKLTSPPTHATLRQLFVERFQYNPGASGEFPAIYVKDREVGVHYELEEMGELREGSLLSLNIDDVQQVKQHIDQGLLALAQEMKELKTTVTAMRRVSVSANTLFSPEPSSHLHASASSPVIRASPSERQFQDAAQKVIRMRRLGSTNALASPSPDAEPLSPKSEGPPPPTTSTSTLPPPITTTAALPATTATTATTADTDSLLSPTRSDAYSAQVVSTLKTQHSEVQNLRRDISVLRQIYVDFAAQTKDMMAATRVQTAHVANLAAKKISQERKFVEAGTAKLEAESTDLVVKVDELQDTIDQIRQDTLRGIRARPSQLSELGVALNKATKERQEMMEWVAKVKPSWATTWSEELQVVLTEQALVQDKETLLRELGEDLDDVKGVLKNIETVSKQSGGGGKGVNGVGGGGRPNPRTFDFGGNDGSSAGGSEDGQTPAFLLEVRGLRPDPQKRLDAIARAEERRQAELASRTDEFADELGGFVAGGRLKKSGGIEETERVRQARSEATLKAMFST